MSISPQSLVGRVIADRYKVISLLGQGGMGRVYLAEHVRMGRKSALKVMSPQLAASTDAVARFHREAANASRINHQHVAGIYDFGETDDGLLYLAMEYVEGEPLTRILERDGRNGLPMRRAAEITRQIAEGLAAAHHLGIVHRDLKPDNVMIARGLDGSDCVKLVDFGIAKSNSPDISSQTVTTAGMSLGTPEYMSPEQLAGERSDARTDVYALGLVLFNMLTGHLPHPRVTSRETLVRRLTAPPQSLADVRPDVGWPFALQLVLDQALTPDVALRYASVAELARDALDAATAHDNGRGVLLATTDAGRTPERPSGAGATVPLAVNTGEPVAAQKRGRSWRLFGLIGITVAGAIGGPRIAAAAYAPPQAVTQQATPRGGVAGMTDEIRLHLDRASSAFSRDDYATARREAQDAERLSRELRVRFPNRETRLAVDRTLRDVRRRTLESCNGARERADDGTRSQLRCDVLLRSSIAAQRRVSAR